MLIDCLDNTTASASPLAGKPVALGIACSEGLMLVYHGPTARTSDVAGYWPGQLAPSASAQDMRAAKAARLQAQKTAELICL